MSFLISFLSTICFKGECQDSDEGKTDRSFNNCKTLYNDNPHRCGKYDDDNFFANSMCCACKGIF